MFIFSYLLGIYLNRRYGNYGHFFIDDIHLKSLFENNQRRLHVYKILSFLRGSRLSVRGLRTDFRGVTSTVVSLPPALSYFT